MDPISLEYVLLHEAARESVEASISVDDVLDARVHACEDLRGLLGRDDQFVRVVPYFCVRGEARLEGGDVGGFYGIEERICEVLKGVVGHGGFPLGIVFNIRLVD